MTAGRRHPDELAAALAGMRVSYDSANDSGGLDEADLASTWYEQLAGWLDDALGAGLPESNAMVLATTDAEGLPSTRTVLAKGLDERGVVFYTNLGSAKMQALKATPFAAATFPWIALHRQVHLRGPIEVLTPEQSAPYWRTRPRGAQLGAWASAQSTAVPDRHTLDEALAAVTARFAGVEQVPLPPHWGGVRIRPVSAEFWQGRPNRMHDRLIYHIPPNGTHTITRLAP